jgi:hypothetical protein
MAGQQPVGERGGVPRVIVLWEEPTPHFAEVRRWLDEQVDRLRGCAEVADVSLDRFTAIASGWPCHHGAMLEIDVRDGGADLWRSPAGGLVEELAGDLRLLGAQPVVLQRREDG